MEIKKYDLSEERYLKHVIRTLEKIPKDEEATMVILCHKTKKLSDEHKGGSPIFLIESTNSDSVIANILEWADKISRENVRGKDVRIQYMVARLSSRDFELLHDGNVKDNDLKMAYKQFWAESVYAIENACR